MWQKYAQQKYKTHAEAKHPCSTALATTFHKQELGNASARLLECGNCIVAIGRAHGIEKPRYCGIAAEEVGHKPLRHFISASKL